MAPIPKKSSGSPDGKSKRKDATILPDLNLLSTSTRAQQWQIQCEEFAKTSNFLEIRDVAEQHMAFIHSLADRHGRSWLIVRNVVVFYPPSSQR